MYDKCPKCGQRHNPTAANCPVIKERVCVQDADKSIAQAVVAAPKIRSPKRSL